ncbi:sugar phosphate isomerase/epimerase family protein [Tropicimonas aquimaris]|uniref:Sugar phosphate isomerase/epimerase family protein n=1 Tax=Tropicimonas aquimaris TaxID=914152 RepID=A0ABW3IWN6_9RHOB
MIEVPDVFVSSIAFGERDFAGLVHKAQSWGANKIELTHGITREDKLESQLVCQSQLQFIVHNYSPPPPEPFVLNLASEDLSTLETSLAHCRRAIELSQKLQARYFSVHAGFAAIVKPEHLGKQIPAENRRDKAVAKAIFEASIRELVDFGAKHGVGILVENNVVAEPNLIEGRNDMLLLATGEELAEFAERMGGDHLGLLIDFGHVKVTAATLGLDCTAFFDLVSPHTRALHLSDNNGSHDSNEPFNRDSWITNTLANFAPEYIVVETRCTTRSQLAACIDAIEVAYG